MFFTKGLWTLTDDDSNQIQRKIECCDENGKEVSHFYEMYQITETAGLYGEHAYGISHAVIDPDDISMNEILSTYDYGSESNFRNEYGKDWEAVAAECEFGMEALDCLIGGCFETWEEAKNYLRVISGYPCFG